jgi:hypothetical protein
MSQDVPGRPSATGHFVVGLKYPSGTNVKIRGGFDKLETKGYLLSMSKAEEAGLILKLYDLRREETMRKARDWYFREFNPQSLADFNSALFGEHSGHMRMVITYWDMAASLVNHGAIGMELFHDCNGEHIGVFSKIEPLLGEIRAMIGSQFANNLEKLIDAIPDGRKKTSEARERMKAIRAQIAQQARTAHQG